MAVAAALAAILTAGWVLLDSPSGGITHLDPVAVTTAQAGSDAQAGPDIGAPPLTSDSPGPSGDMGQTAVVIVDVAGLVSAPGVYTLPGGSRVADALAAAGGALPGVDLTALNLARKLVDGEQIPVGVTGAVGAPGPPPASGAATGPAAAIDLNTATEAQLDELPGVGPVLAQNILAWRSENGAFESIDQLREVSGIGDAKYAQIKGRVRI